MQAAFREQNPCIITSRDGRRLRKETAYVFDFDPARTLIIFDEFANSLSLDTVDGRGTGDDRKNNIKRLLNFFPVLGEDDEGRMVELDAAQVLSIPRRLKSQEVVRHGFMSNFLFQNISNIFGAPTVVKTIVEKLTPAHEDSKKRDQEKLSHISDVSVDEDGEVEIPNEIIIGKTQGLFGEKHYEKMEQDLQPQLEQIAQNISTAGVQHSMQGLANTIKQKLNQDIIAPAADAYGVKKSTQHRLEKHVECEIDRKFEELQGDYEQKANVAKAEMERRQQEAESTAEFTAAETDFHATMEEAMQELVQSAQNFVQDKIGRAHV